MGIFFTVGEKKKRPGVYQRYENVGGVSVAGATDGIVACCVKSNFGELSKVMTFESVEAAKAALGNGSIAGTVDMLTEIFTAGAKKIYCVRLGSGGTKGSVKLKDTTENTPADAINIIAKSEGDRAFTFTVRKVLGDENSKEFIAYEANVEVEKFKFAAGTGEAQALVEAGKKSSFFDFVLEADYAGNGTLANVLQKEFTGGANPTVTNESYSNAFVLLEPFTFNALCVDTNDVGVHTLLSAFINRIYKNGNILPYAVIGEPMTVDFDTRLSHAKAFNNYNVVYVGGGAISMLGEKLQGYRAAARVAGMVASLPSNQSLTHKVLSGMVDVMEKLTNSQYEAAIDAGMMAFSLSANGNVQIDSAITTLNSLQGDDDEGWKKIKRTKIRKELMNRASVTVEPLIGNINNDPDGRATVMQAINGLLQLMVNEKKLLADPVPYINVDTANLPQGDSAWFNIGADDIDSLEKAYFVYKFRYSPNV